MPACVTVLEKVKVRFPNYSNDDYLFLPAYRNRMTAIQIINRQFNKLLSELEIKNDPITAQKYTVYSLRHTAICMRLIKSEGKVNIFNLAKTAGTSVEQIERFYARHLPLSAEMARNLQSFGA
jgi:integrase